MMSETKNQESDATKSSYPNPNMVLDKAKQSSEQIDDVVNTNKEPVSRTANLKERNLASETGSET
jgi:hypothetical protein